MRTNNLRSTIAGVTQNKRVRAIALEVMGGRASVKIVGSSQVLYGLSVTGGNITAGQEVYVDYTTGTPIVHSYQEQTASAPITRIKARTIIPDPDLPVSSPLPDAPYDDVLYGRKNASWQVITSGSSPTSGSPIINHNELSGLQGGIEEIIATTSTGSEIIYTLDGVTYKAYVFTSSGSITIGEKKIFDYLVVGGGGSSGGGTNGVAYDAPGGGGEVKIGSQEFEVGTISVVVGAQTAQPTTGVNGYDGNQSSLSNIVSVGGKGGYKDGHGGNSGNDHTGSVRSGTTSGGGAGDSANASGINGGNGTPSSITGTEKYYGGGGPGAGYGSYGTPGLGTGIANSGGGGTGANETHTMTPGYSGVVILREIYTSGSVPAQYYHLSEDEHDFLQEIISTSGSNLTGTSGSTSGNVISEASPSESIMNHIPTFSNQDGKHIDDSGVDVWDLATKANVLELDNETPFTPDQDYEPATKKYVDDHSGTGSGVEEAPNDGKLYGRKDESWVEVESSGSPIAGGTVNKSIWSSDAIPSSTTSQSDEFTSTGSAIDGKWSEFDPNSKLVPSIDVSRKLLKLTGSRGTGVNLTGIYQTVPDGNFTIWTKMNLMISSPTRILAGLALWEDPTDINKTILTNGLTLNITTLFWDILKWNNYTIANELANLNSFPSCYLRIRRNGNDYYSGFSLDGLSWIENDSFNPLATPTKFGLFFDLEGYSVVNIASGKSGVITDGSKDTNNFADVGTGLCYTTIDLGASYSINQIKVWHYFGDGRTYHDVIVMVSNDSVFATKTIVFNNDTNNSASFGTGSDSEYAESINGKTIDFDTVLGRYVRLYSNGSSANSSNHYVEVEIYPQGDTLSINCACFSFFRYLASDVGVDGIMPGNTISLME